MTAELKLTHCEQNCEQEEDGSDGWGNWVGDDETGTDGNASEKAGNEGGTINMGALELEHVAETKRIGEQNRIDPVNFPCRRTTHTSMMCAGP